MRWRTRCLWWYAKLMEPRDDPRPGYPMTLTVHLPDELEQRLRERASRDGRAVEEYVLRLIERDAAGLESGPVIEASGLRLGQGAALSEGEFERLLDDLASGPGLPHLPADFSRADLYF